MSTDPAAQSANVALAAVRSDHHCFGCGDENPIGLHLVFSTTDRGVQAHFSPSTEYQGFKGVVHGGIISSVLDEAMAWATAASGIWAVTAEMRVRFRHPLHVGQRTTVSGEITSQRGRRINTSAFLTADGDGRELASATATFIRVDAETEAAWRARYLVAPSPGVSSGEQPGDN